MRNTIVAMAISIIVIIFNIFFEKLFILSGLVCVNLGIWLVMEFKDMKRN